MSEDVGSGFQQVLGAFGAHSDPKKRAKAERMAVMRPDDKRRKRGVVRGNQFNVRISDAAKENAELLIAHLGQRDGASWSQADLIEHALDVLMSKYKPARQQ